MVTDYFTAFNASQRSSIDADLGSGGLVVLPDLIDGARRVHGHLAVGGGKDHTSMSPIATRWGNGIPRATRSTRMSLERWAEGCSRRQPISATPCTSAPWACHQGLFRCERSAFLDRGLENHRCVCVSGSHAEHFRERHNECDSLGRGEYQPGRPARARCARFVAGVVQFQASTRWQGRVRHRKQVHHADDCQRTRVRGDHQWRGRVRPAESSHALGSSRPASHSIDP